MTGSEQLGGFVPGTKDGDPGKLAYFHNPAWRPKLFSNLGGVKKRDFCPGCTWPGENRVHEGASCKLEARN